MAARYQPCVTCGGCRLSYNRRTASRAPGEKKVEDALAVCAAFDTTNRLADAFGFAVLSPEGFAAGAKYLLKRGYR